MMETQKLHWLHRMCVCTNQSHLFKLKNVTRMLQPEVEHQKEKCSNENLWPEGGDLNATAF